MWNPLSSSRLAFLFLLFVLLFREFHEDTLLSRGFNESHKLKSMLSTFERLFLVSCVLKAELVPE